MRSSTVVGLRPPSAGSTLFSGSISRGWLPWACVLAALFLSARVLQAQTYTPPTVSEYTLFSNLIASNSTALTMVTSMASRSTADSTGLVGVNSPSNSATIYPDFVAEDQRGAFIPMIAAILIGNDSEVYSGWKSLIVAYNQQNANGTFGTSPTSDCTGSQCMRFFMAESDHALIVLGQSPYVNKVVPDGSGQTYGTEMTNLLPKIKLAVDFMLSQSTRDSHDSLYGDFGSPNRALSDSNAFALSYYLLLNYAPAAGSLAGYDSEAQWWINTIFVQNAFYTYRPLANTTTGIYYEGDGTNGFGYDTSYGGVNLDQVMKHAYYFPNHFTGAFNNSTNAATSIDPNNLMLVSGRWLQQRIFYPTDPLGLNSTPFVDDTDNTRTGPTGVAEATKANDFGIADAQIGLMFYTALFNRPEGVLCVSGPSDPVTDYTLVINRPPVIFNDPSILTVSATKGTAITTYNVYATNTGIQSGNTQTLDPAFSMTAANLPPGLSFSGPYTYPSNLQLDDGLGVYVITGTPTQFGNYNVVLTPTNMYGTGAPVTLTISVGPFPTITFTVPNHTYGDAPFAVSATSNSTGAITYSYVSGPASISGSTVTLTGAGTVTLLASQAASSSYGATTQQTSFMVQDATLAVGVSGTPSRVFGQVNPIFPYSISGFISPDTQSSATTGAPSLTTTAVPKSAAGNYTINVGQGTLAATNYGFSFTTGTLTVNGGALQAIFFPPLANFSHTASVPLIALASSGLPVSFSVSGPGSVSGNILTFTGTGQVTVTASQSGNSNFAAATSVVRTLTAQ